MSDNKKNEIPEKLTDGTDSSLGALHERSHSDFGGFSGKHTSDTKYWGRCDSGNHRPWKTARCDTYDEAYGLCQTHNETCDAKGASVTTF